MFFLIFFVQSDIARWHIARWVATEKQLDQLDQLMVTWWFGIRIGLPSLKLTAKAPENGWLEDDPFLFGVCLFSGANLLLVSERVTLNSKNPF